MKSIKSLLLIFSFVFALSLTISAQTLTALDGARVDVENQKDKVVVLAIGASWLPAFDPASRHHQQTRQRYAGRDVVVLFRRHRLDRREIEKLRERRRTQ
jgi:hypothetical protein